MKEFIFLVKGKDPASKRKESEKRVRPYFEWMQQLLLKGQFKVFGIFIAMIIIFQPPVVAQKNNKNSMNEHVNNADSVKGVTIHQEIDFNVSPQQVYQALLSSEQFSAFTKKSFDMFTATSAKIDAKEGGTFSVFDGHIIGRILELVPNERIVEAWRVVDWPAGAYSIAKFEFKSKNPGTNLIFDHIGFPEGLKEHLTIGWQQHYWDALTKYFQERQ
jgi:activator of HSP90 ATPase